MSHLQASLREGDIEIYIYIVRVRGMMSLKRRVKVGRVIFKRKHVSGLIYWANLLVILLLENYFKID